MARRFSARRYAQALFELGAPQDKLEKWSGDLARVAGLGSDSQVVAFLEHPRIDQETKDRLLTAAAAGVSPEVLNLVFMLVKRGAVARLPEVNSAFQKLVELREGIERGRLTAPIALSPAETGKISSQVGEIIAKKVILDSDIDESLLGGMVVRVAGKLLDGSTKSALAILKQRLS